MAKAKPDKPQRRRLKLTQLMPYALQTAHSPTTSEEEDEQLLADLRDNGQRDPILVVPAKGRPGRFVILDGHRRVAAFKSLGLKQIWAVVRMDLARAGAAAVEAEFLRIANNRRHLNKLDRARNVLRLFELEKGRPRNSVRLSEEEGEARDRVGRVLGVSGRHLQRLFRVLLAPLPVQDAVRDRRLPMVVGEQVEGLPDEQQAEIARRIEAGEDPKTVVQNYCRGNKRCRKPRDGVVALVRSLKRAAYDLDGRIAQLHPALVTSFVPHLEHGRRLIEELLDHIRSDPGATDAA